VICQVWSNDLYNAAEHRVRASRDKVRYSAPFFYNPSYDTLVSPLTCYNHHPTAVNSEDEEVDNQSNRPHYSSIRWGDFRASRFAGDYADVGKDIQIEDFKIVEQ